MKKICIAALLCVFLSGSFTAVRRQTAGAENGVDNTSLIEAVADGIIDWKKSDVGSSPEEYLINDTFLRQAGTTAGDWYPIGLSRYGKEDHYEGYRAVVNDVVDQRYRTKEKLSAAKATEWHRIALAVLASGGDPRRMGAEQNIDLIADGTYHRVDENGAGILGKQGINGFIWGLLALDSKRYEVPEGAFYSRGDIIAGILQQQLGDGGFALQNGKSDPEITGMAIQALAPYYNSEVEFTYTLTYQKKKVTKKVRSVIDEAVELLSAVQTASGGYESYGIENTESGVQVLAALCALGIDPVSDERFMKNGNTVLDGILQFLTPKGGFTHSNVKDEAHPSAVPGEPNSMASEQALYGMVALSRACKGMRRLYDFRQEQTPVLAAQIAEVSKAIRALDKNSGRAQVQEVYDRYIAIDETERSYVSGYAALSKLAAYWDISYVEEDLEAGMSDEPSGYLEEFTERDKELADALPQGAALTTYYRVSVEKLWYKIHNCFDFVGMERYRILLDQAKYAIAEIQTEIDAIRVEIKASLYPFDRVGLSKRGIVYDLYHRYTALSEYDRSQFAAADIEGLLKSKTQVDNALTALVVGICCGVAASLGVLWIVLRIRKRKRVKNEREMPESEE